MPSAIEQRNKHKRKSIPQRHSIWNMVKEATGSHSKNTKTQEECTETWAGERLAEKGAPR